MIKNRPSKHAHKLVHETAVSMAHELYDTMMQIDEFYAWWKKLNPDCSSVELENRFVARNLGTLVPQARATLAGMLRTCQDESLRDQIYEALLLDNTLIRGRGASYVN